MQGKRFEKLSMMNNMDPCVLAAQAWITDSDTLPPLTYLHIVNYLVFGLTAYTVRELRIPRSS